MRLVSRRHFATLCMLSKITPQYIGTQIKRGLIKELYDDRGKKLGIDADDPLHRRFIKEKVREHNESLRAPKKEIEVVEVVEEKPKIVNPNRLSKTQSKKVNKEKKEIEEIAKKSSDESEQVHSLDLRKKKAEVLKIEREAEIKLLDIIKKNGEALPTDFVVRMVTVLMREMLAKFDSSTIRIAGKFCDIVGADRDLLVRVNNDLNYEMQAIIDEAEKDCKYQIKNAIKEYSITRGKGERDLK